MSASVFFYTSVFESEENMAKNRFKSIKSSRPTNNDVRISFHRMWERIVESLAPLAPSLVRNIHLLMLMLLTVLYWSRR